MKKLLAFTFFVLFCVGFAQAEPCLAETEAYLTDIFSSHVAEAGIDYSVGKCYFFRKNDETDLYFLFAMLSTPALSLGAGEDIFSDLIGNQTQTKAYPSLTGWRLEGFTGNGTAELAYGTPEYLAEFMGWEEEEFKSPNFYRLIYLLNVKP